MACRSGIRDSGFAKAKASAAGGLLPAKQKRQRRALPFFVVRERTAQCGALLVAGAGAEMLAMAWGENLPP
jgi:hypothetical protein